MEPTTVAGGIDIVIADSILARSTGISVFPVISLPWTISPNDLATTSERNRKSFPRSGASGPSRVLANIGFSLHENEILGLVGPPGCGKSALSRIIAELESQPRGR